MGCVQRHDVCPVRQSLTEASRRLDQRFVRDYMCDFPQARLPRQYLPMQVTPGTA